MDIRALQKKLGITMIFVTHDQEEAMILSDRIFVMSEGKIMQQATPAELYSGNQKTTLWQVLLEIIIFYPQMN